MNVSFLSSPDSYSRILYSIGCLCLPIHIFGGYCIVFQTPKNLYISVLAQPFVCTPAFAGFPLGILKAYFGINTRIVVWILAFSAILVGVAKLSIFENRFYTLYGHNTVWKTLRYPFFFGNYSVCSLLALSSLAAIPEQDKARKQLFQIFPEIQVFDTAKSPIFVVFVSNNRLSIQAILFVLLLIFEVLGFVIMIQLAMIKSLKKMTMSKKAIKTQKSLIRGISLQVSIPLFIMLIPKLTTYIIRLFNGPHQEINNVAYFIMSTHGASAAICMIYLQKPYREFTLRILCPMRVQVGKIVVIGS